MPHVIDGKQYTGVGERLVEFRKEYPTADGWGLVAEQLTEPGADPVAFKVSATTPAGLVISIGHAEVFRGSSPGAASTSPVEFCETKALGRCLAKCGFLGDEFASVEEMQHALQSKPRPQPKAQPVTPPAELPEQDAEWLIVTWKEKRKTAKGTISTITTENGPAFDCWDNVCSPERLEQAAKNGEAATITWKKGRNFEKYGGFEVARISFVEDVPF